MAMSSQPFLRLLRSRAPQIRSFTQSPFLKTRSPRPPPPPSAVKSQRPPPIAPSARNTTPAKAVRFAPPQQSQAASSTRLPELQSYALKLLKGSDSLLLFKANKHTGLFISCVVIGSGLFVWVALTANDVFLQYSAPWYAKLVVLAGCMIGSAMATTVMLTPMNLVKTISLIRTAEGSAMLRLTGNRFGPFKTTTIDMELGKPMIDRNVVTSLEAGRNFFVVPQGAAQQWTEGKTHRAPSGGALLNAWPTTKSYVKKMFNRENFSYMRAKNHNWKLDLEECEILEKGQLLTKFVREGAVKSSPLDMFARGIWGAA